MTRSVVWSREARGDLAAIFRHIAADSPEAADRVVDRIDVAANSLGSIPTGRPGRVTGVYEKSIAGLPYIVAYEILARPTSEEIVILHVIHTSRRWPEGGWPQD
ncbi:type II toxin-antitoxin system RelE/ParE family toxin [Methylopila sp. M107]|uniref:type II toxin-antitoxin system RelE/ParE family toxin n=1 Tax=Methylopila sp. M107 TaxID=1101190 RepID=UPI0003673AD4|nr:type II toxin-antitoxin system RelE/ParE family toxin [Methylopila sp. M107]